MRKRVCDLSLFSLLISLRFRMALWGGVLWGLLLMGEEEVSALEAEVVRLRAGIQNGKMGGRE